MKKVLFTLLLLALVSATPKSDTSLTEETVASFYNNLKILSLGERNDANYEATESCIHMVASSGASLFFPNEFKEFGVESSPEEDNLLCVNYVSNFKKLAEKHHMQFSYRITSIIPYPEIEYKKSDEEASFTHYIVEKRYGPSVFSGIIQDTVLFDNTKKLIIGIRNFAGGEAYTRYSHQTIVPVIEPTTVSVSPETGVNLEGLQFAASAFSKQKKYTEAFNAYQTILQHDPNNANAYYRLAILSYRRLGCRQYSKKKTDEMAMTYIHKAYDNGDAKMKSKIDNVLYYW